MLYATALEGGSVTVATAAVVLAETTPPAVVGVMFLGDHTRPGLGGVALLGFSLAIVCAVALARFGETDEQGLTAAVAYNYRCHPLLAALREALRAGRFGRPVELIAVAGQHFPTYRPAYRSI